MGKSAKLLTGNFTAFYKAASNKFVDQKEQKIQKYWW
jgi:hypothetical protein